MDKIRIKYENEKSQKSDINEHLETIYRYSKECSHITEFGVRWVSSTWAMILSEPKKMYSYDILYNPKIEEVISLSKEYGINFTFEEADVLKIKIEPTELLFIDTLHTYNQLITELSLHSDKVSKYIIFHDTSTYGLVDEKVYNHASNTIKNMNNTKRGLVTAINDFLTTESGQFWKIHEVFRNNNGLTILKNINYEN